MSARFAATRTLVSSNIRQLRQHRGMSLDDLSGRAGIAKSSASQLENGHSNPTLATLVAVADALEVSVHDLLHM